MCKILISIIAFTFLNFGSKSNDILYPEKSKVLSPDFAKYDNFFPLAIMDFSNKGVEEKINIIFVSFNYNGKEFDENFPKNQSMGNFTFKIQDDGKYKPTFKKNAMKVEEMHKPYFLITKQKYLKAKAENKDIMYLIKKYDEPDWWQADETPVNSKGEKFKFLCQFEIEEFLGDSCCVYVFYDKKDREVKYIAQGD